MNNDLMNPPPPQQRMNPPPPLQVMNPVQPRIMNQAPLLNQSQSLNHTVMVMNQQPQAMLNNNNQPLMMNPRNYNLNPSLSSEYHNQPNNFPSKMNRNNNNWKGKKIANDKRPPMMRMRNNNNSAIPIYNPGGYKPPALNELQSQNRLKTRKFYPKKKYGANNNNNNNRYVPYAPRNTTSFIIRAKKSGGIAELVSPSPLTPAVLPTPMFSPSREVLGDMAKEEWGVDGYGSMKGLIRLRSDGHELEPYDDDEVEEEGDGSSESDVEEHVEVERRIDHDLSRFEMIYPSYGGGSEYNNVLENRVDDQDSHIAQLEEENLTLKERLFLMERELGDLRRRLQYLERRNMVAGDVNEEVVENESESEGDDTGGSDARTSGDTKENLVVAEDVCMQDVGAKENNDSKSKADEAKETQHTIGKEQGEKGFEQCEEANPVMVGMDQSKGNEMAIEKVEDASENDSIGEQGTTI
ncbi:hypothetical protein Rs2_33605 [Raphanus sativus]|uniref:Uncharacterized protein LOC108817933 n=1 Tax=Raphanus sativus TaxID=3726 RepID=A0A6J0KE55_RAPSA|nr:uncharacterized protein LOC108817933 [Raphanus sativus]XP_056846820.1 uncharacterized protein LOC108817933 [Raphanus sativus]XP_056846821.1 uncharacterized protein LOC108817933 [Raphanus sativus]KAJ4883512.1 hypothetical protein Rs2_33605 [Raphanus sativus]